MKILFNWTYPNGNAEEAYLDNGEVWALKGECRKCGACCDPMACGHLKSEKFTNEEGITSDQRVCDIAWCKPGRCLLYPFDPYDKLNESCGFTWEQTK